MSTILLGDARENAALRANQEDASVWRWFGALYEYGRLRWCKSYQGWLVSVNHRHLATEPDFDTAIRTARERHLFGQHKGSGDENFSSR